jgi:DNA-directed RNA polymerase specialized sigma24 family protein
MRELTQILHAAQQGDANAPAQLLPLVYEELRRLAAHRMAPEAAGHTLQPTALVHEAWIRLVGDDAPLFANRAHFFSAAAEAMRRILIESARRKHRLKRGGNLARLAAAQFSIAGGAKGRDQGARGVNPIASVVDNERMADDDYGCRASHWRVASHFLSTACGSAW